LELSPKNCAAADVLTNGARSPPGFDSLPNLLHILLGPVLPGGLYRDSRSAEADFIAPMIENNGFDERGSGIDTEQIRFGHNILP
jgi:hypothetical protein